MWQQIIHWKESTMSMGKGPADSMPAKHRTHDQLRCGATKPTGRPCRAYANASGYCTSHSMTPEQREQRALAGVAALARVTDELHPDFRSAKKVRRTLQRAADLVARGKLSVASAKAVAQLAAQALRAIEAANEEALLNLEDAQRGQS
jgi:hypothetical protein